MTLESIMNELSLELLTETPLNKEPGNVYIGDLLSSVMASLSEGDIWITILAHMNIVAVAVLSEAAAIIIAEGAKADGDTIKKASEEGIPIFSSEKSAYELAVSLGKLI